MPGEWEPHERCLMAWPCRRELWGELLDAAKAEFVATAEAIARFEPVTMIVDPADVDEAAAMLGDVADLLTFPLDDSWMRDSGPIIAVSPSGRRIGLDFVFNSWGEKYVPYDDDQALASSVLAALGLPRVSSAMVLEGGAITVDGQGTLIATEQCLLHPNRNPGMTKQAIEDELRRTLGVETVIWLPWGQYDDTDTDGHVDGVCTFVRPGAVLINTEVDPARPDTARMAENAAVLRAAVDARGRRLDVLELPPAPTFELGGETCTPAYANFYVANGGVVVPIVGADEDTAALEAIRRAFPDREVVGVISRVIAYGGGGTHCITQQVPAAPPGW